MALILLNYNTKQKNDGMLTLIVRRWLIWQKVENFWLGRNPDRPPWLSGFLLFSLRTFLSVSIALPHSARVNFLPVWAICKTTFSPKLCVMLKILSSEYKLYACGKISRMPWFWTKILVLQKARLSINLCSQAVARAKLKIGRKNFNICGYLVSSYFVSFGNNEPEKRFFKVAFGQRGNYLST